MAAECGCRWARIEEHRIEEQEGEEVEREVSSVFTHQDATRYGLQSAKLAGKLVAVRYRERGRLVGWRLMIEPGERSDD